MPASRARVTFAFLSPNIRLDYACFAGCGKKPGWAQQVVVYLRTVHNITCLMWISGAFPVQDRLAARLRFCWGI